MIKDIAIVVLIGAVAIATLMVAVKTIVEMSIDIMDSEDSSNEGEDL